jgi:hypothetical protein
MMLQPLTRGRERNPDEIWEMRMAKDWEHRSSRKAVNVNCSTPEQNFAAKRGNEEGTRLGTRIWRGAAFLVWQPAICGDFHPRAGTSI